MVRPRIIIADTDINYIIPLQQKFIEEFFEKVDLEIITDTKYYHELFNVPQQADILIVSEDLYDSSMQRHNIRHIYLLMEQNEEERTSDLNVARIFKYTSTNKVFNEIIGKSTGVFQVDVDSKKETEIVLVYSACGGVGKTTVAMGISACLSQNYKKVLYIDAENLQTFQRLLDNQSPVSAMDVYAKLSDPSDQVYDEVKHVIRKEGFSYLPPFKAALMSLGLRFSLYEKMILSAKKTNEYDYIVVDTDSAFNEDKVKLFGIADKVIIVTEQSASAVYTTNTLVANVTGMSSEKYVFVCNNFRKDRDNALISPAFIMKFAVSDYIAHMTQYDHMKCNDLACESGIQKVAFLIM